MNNELAKDPAGGAFLSQEVFMPNDLEGWLTDVLSGEGTMSQRGARWVEAQGGLDAVVAAAKARGVHLVQLTSDEGKTLVAASLSPFKSLC